VFDGMLTRDVSLSSSALQVQECYELSAEYETDRDEARIAELGAKLTSLSPADSIVISSSFSHMLNLANLAEEVQIANRRRTKLKRGDFGDEASAPTESDIEETLKRLVSDLGKSREEVFDALKNQTVDLVFTAHPTQSVRRSLLQKHGRCGDFSSRVLIIISLAWRRLLFVVDLLCRIRDCLKQLYAKDITADDKQELDEALQREVIYKTVATTIFRLCFVMNNPRLLSFMTHST
jgi:phosphoenolpyruvate carboxylase